MDPRSLDAGRFLNLVTYYAAEVYIVENRPLSEKHAAARRDVYERFTGHLSTGIAPVVSEVEQRTGIAPPSWFRAEGTTLSDAQQIANAARGRTT